MEHLVHSQTMLYLEDNNILDVNQVGDPRNFYYGRSISRLLPNNILRVLKSATREPVVIVNFL